MPFSSPQPLLLRAVCASAVLILPACGNLRYGGSKSQDDALNALRAENHALKDQLAAKDKRIAELTSAAATVNTTTAADVLAATPRPATLIVDSFSGVYVEKGDAVARFYIQPRDGRDNPMQVTGSMHVEVLVTDATGKASPLAERTLAPSALRDAYRDSFIGTYYRVDVPVGSAAIKAGAAYTLRATFTDATSTLTLTAERAGPAKSSERPSPTGKQGV